MAYDLLLATAGELRQKAVTKTNRLEKTLAKIDNQIVLLLHYVGPMNQAITDLSGNTLFELRLRQAILAAQHDVKQVGLLLIDIDGTGNLLIQDSEILKNSLRRFGFVSAWY